MDLNTKSDEELLALIREASTLLLDRLTALPVAEIASGEGVGLAVEKSAPKKRGRPKKVPWVGGRREFKSVYVDVARAAQVLGKNPQWVYDHTSRSEPIIPHYRPGGPAGAPMFIEAELHDFIRSTRCTVMKLQYRNPK